MTAMNNLASGLFRGILTTIVLSACASSASGQIYGVVDLGTLGGPTSDAFAVNSAGHVVGDSTLANADYRGFFRNSVPTSHRAADRLAKPCLRCKRFRPGCGGGLTTWVTWRPTACAGRAAAPPISAASPRAESTPPARSSDRCQVSILTSAGSIMPQLAQRRHHRPRHARRALELCLRDCG